MAKDNVGQWDTTAENNTDIAGINIAEGCPPSSINNAIRTIMAQIKAKTGLDAEKLNGEIASFYTSASNMTGTVPIANGGTGATTAEGARGNFGIGFLGTLSTIPINDAAITGTLNVSKGGTGTTSISGIQASLGLQAMAYVGAVNLTSQVFGVLPVPYGGTGVQTYAGIAANLGLGTLAYSNGQTAAQVGAAASYGTGWVGAIVPVGQLAKLRNDTGGAVSQGQNVSGAFFTLVGVGSQVGSWIVLQSTGIPPAQEGWLARIS